MATGVAIVCTILVSGKTRGRSGTTSSRYKQDYPCEATFIASPIRRASSETKFAVLQKRDAVETLRRKSEINGHQKELTEEGSQILHTEAAQQQQQQQQQNTAITTGTENATHLNVNSLPGAGSYVDPLLL